MFKTRKDFTKKTCINISHFPKYLINLCRFFLLQGEVEGPHQRLFSAAVLTWSEQVSICCLLSLSLFTLKKGDFVCLYPELPNTSVTHEISTGNFSIKQSSSQTPIPQILCLLSLWLKKSFITFIFISPQLPKPDTAISKTC